MDWPSHIAPRTDGDLNPVAGEPKNLFLRLVLTVFSLVGLVTGLMMVTLSLTVQPMWVGLSFGTVGLVIVGAGIATSKKSIALIVIGSGTVWLGGVIAFLPILANPFL